jgi:hypothetical protein
MTTKRPRGRWRYGFQGQVKVRPRRVGFRPELEGLEGRALLSSTTTLVDISSGETPFGTTLSIPVTITSGDGSTPTGYVELIDQNTGELYDVVELDGSGHATLNAAFNSEAGSTQVYAHYEGSGDGAFDPSDSAGIPIQVDQLTPNLDISSSNTNPVAGDTVTFTGSVTTPGSGLPTPTGTVEFYDANTGDDLGGAALDGNGNATFYDSFSAGQNPAVIAVYQGDADYTTVTSNQTLLETVKGRADVYAYVSPSVAAYGQAVTLQAGVYPDGNGPSSTGTVEFLIDGSPAGQAVLNNEFASLLTPRRLAPGDHQVTVDYQGDSNYGAATRAPADLSVVMPTGNPDLQLVSQADPATQGVTGAGASYAPVVSGDGRFVVFLSQSNDLLANTAGGSGTQLYLKDRQTGETQLITVPDNGQTGSSSSPEDPTISRDGSTVAFDASDYGLVPDTNYQNNAIYIDNVQTGTLSIASDGVSTSSYTDNVGKPALSADGRYVAFLAQYFSGGIEAYVYDSLTGATTLVSPQTNQVDFSNAPQISDDGSRVLYKTTDGAAYVYDIPSGATYLISADAQGNPAVAADATMSGDGSRVAYLGWAAIAGAPGGTTAAFLDDLGNATTTLVSRNTSSSPSRDSADFVTMSHDGSTVAFTSVEGLTPGSAPGVGEQSYTYSVGSGTLFLATAGTSGQGISGSVYRVSLSGDGQVLAFEAASSDLIAGGTSAPAFYATAGGSTRRLAGADLSNSVLPLVNAGPIVSADGSTVAFATPDSTLVPNDDNGTVDVFTYSMADGSIGLVSNRMDSPDSATPDGWSTLLGSSADGSRVLFQSTAPDIVPGVGGRNTYAFQLFVRDLVSQTTTAIPMNPAQGFVAAALSPDGRSVAFSAFQYEIAPGDFENGVFLHDLDNGTTTLVANTDYTNEIHFSPDGRYLGYKADSGNALYVTDLQTAGTQWLANPSLANPASPGNGYIVSFALSDVGTVFFDSYATDLVAGDTRSFGYNDDQIYERDLTGGSTTLVTASTGGGPSTSTYYGTVQSFVISADGRYVAFVDNATDLVPEEPFPTGRYALYLRDTVAGTTTPVAPADALVAGGGLVTAPSLSQDGRYLAYLAGPNPYYGGQSDYVYDQATRQASVVSVDPSGQSLTDPWLPVISADGRYVAFSDFVTPATYVRDLQTQTTQEIDPNFVPYQSLDIGNLSISQDGKTVAFQSGNSSLMPGDYNNAVNVYAYTTLSSSTTTVATRTSLALPDSPTLYGQPARLVATVTPNVPTADTPSGVVEFTLGSTVLGTATLDPTGTATLTYPNLPVGSENLVATYEGSVGFAGSASDVATQVVNLDTTTTTLAPSPASSVFGQAVTFTASVSADGPGAGTPTGTVIFSAGGATLATVAVGPNGTAYFTTSALETGAETVSVTYSGGTNFTSSSASISQTVNLDAASVSLSTSETPSPYGQELTQTATVSAAAPGSGQPTETVDFFDGTTELGQADVNPTTGQATITLSDLLPGTHSLTADYGGDTNFLAGSGTMSQVVEQVTTTTSLTAAPSNPTYGDTVTLTATVAPGSSPDPGVATGTVTFLDGTTTLGTVALSGGTASLNVSGLGATTHSLSAVYSGDSSYIVSTGTKSLAVAHATPAVTLSSSVVSPVFGQAVTFTALVSSTAGSPTGSVTFDDGTTTLGTVALDDSGRASLTLSSLGVGSDDISASYSGDANFTQAIQTLTLAVIQAQTTVVAATSQVSAPLNEPPTLSARLTVAAPGAGVPTGSVDFVLDGTTDLGSVPLDDFGAASLVPAQPLAVGTHTIAMTYSGDGNFHTAAGSVSQTITTIPNLVLVSATPSPATYGDTVSIAATVAPVAEPAPAVPSGTVDIYDQSTQTDLGTFPLVNGSATVTDWTPQGGAHVLSLSYSGDATYGSGQASLSETVAAAATSTTLATSSPATVTGQAVTLTAAVTSSAGAVTGTVQFLEGTTVLGSAMLDASGHATFATAQLAVESHAIVAAFQGTNDFAASASASASEVVSQDATTTTLSASPSSPVYGQLVRLMASVSANAPGSGTPTGSFTFTVDGVSLATVPVGSDGTASFATSALAVATHGIVAAYSGDASFMASSASGPLIVARDATAVALTTAPDPSVDGSAVTLTASVVAAAPGAGSPTGSVDFLDGATDLGTAPIDPSTGTATLNVSSLTPGAHSLTADYMGDGNFTAGTASATQVVQSYATATTLSASPSSPTFGDTVTLTATVVPLEIAGTLAGSVSFYDGSDLLGVAPLVQGTATWQTSALSAGTHALSAAYDGDGTYQESSGTTTETLARAASSIGLVSSLATTVSGQSVTFTASVSSPAGTPTGDMTFSVGSTPLGTTALDGSGRASLAIATLPVGSVPITASYGGDTNFTGSSAALTQTVQQAQTTVAATSSQEPAPQNQPPAFTATVTALAPGAGVPTGSVDFVLDGTTDLGTVPLGASGIESLTPSAPLTLGSHTVRMTYSGDSNFSGSAQTLTQDVTTISSITSVASSSTTPSYGDTVTLTATAAPASGPATIVPTGSVDFTNEATGTDLGTVPLIDGVGTLSIAALGVGTQTIVAAYSGDASYQPGEGTIVETVSAAATTTTLAPTTPAVYGQDVTLTATVSSPAGPVTGTVAFFDGTFSIGTATLDGTESASLTGPFAVGSYTITAVYRASTDFAGSASAPGTQVVGPASAAVSLATSQSSPVYGQDVTLTASVAPVAPGAGTPTGTVAFTQGGTTLGVASMGADGEASVTLSSLPVGSDLITASYSGDGDFTSASQTLVQTIAQAQTTLAPSSSEEPTPVNEVPTFVATVTATSPGSGQPTGSVDFVLDGSIDLGSVPLNNEGAASLTPPSPLAIGTHTVKMTYSGDANFLPATGSMIQHVIKAASATTVTISPGSPTFGDTVTFDVNVAPASGPASDLPTGSVDLYDATSYTDLGTVSLVNGSGSLSKNALAGGVHAIRATYAGDLNYSANTSTTGITVVPAATTTTLAASAATSVYGQGVTFTATVTSPAGGVTGTVEFLEDGNEFGYAAVDASGNATFTYSALTAGDHAVTATFLATADEAASTSGDKSVSVAQATPATSLYVARTTLALGTVLPLTATVSAPGEDPTGTVIFYDGDLALGGGELDGGGQFTLELSGLQVGTHQITVAYQGDANNQPSQSSATEINITNAATTTTVTDSPAPSTFGQDVTFTVVVTAQTGGAGVPAGVVTLSDGVTALTTLTLDDTGMAVYDTATLSRGNHTITAVYTGAGVFNASVGTVVHAVSKAGTATSISEDASTPTPWVAGQPVTFDIAVTGTGSPGGTVAVMDGTQDLGSATLQASGSATFTTSLAAGTHALTAVYQGDPNNQGSTSSSLAETVESTPTMAVLGVSPSASTFGQTVTLTAQLRGESPSQEVPTGVVTFYDGTTALGTGQINSAGVAQVTTSALGVGSHDLLSVSYPGDANDLACQSLDTTMTVGQASSTTTLSSSLNPAATDHSVTITAQVTAPGSDFVPLAGSVTFSINSIPKQTVGLDADGQASLTLSNLAKGTYSLTASYSGDSNDVSSTSDPLNQVFVATTTTTTLTASSATTVYGQPETLTVAVAPTTSGARTPTGQVIIYDGQTEVIQGTLDAHGDETFTLNSLDVGTHTLAVVYGGDNYNEGGTSSVQTVTVGQASTTIALTNPATVTYGAGLTLTAVVQPVSPSSLVPTGSVAFSYDDGSHTLLGDLDANGTARVTFYNIDAGTHTVFAQYVSTARFAGGPAASGQSDVTPAGTTTTLTSSLPNGSTYGQVVQIAATVVSTTRGIPSGTVMFQEINPTTFETTPLGTVTLDVTGQAALNLTSLPVGGDEITATYGSTTDFSGSDAELTQTVAPASTQISLVSSGSPSSFGKAVTFTATIAPVAPGGGSPVGTVAFYDGSVASGTLLDTEPVVGGVATSAVISTLAAGAHTITAQYTDTTDANFSSSAMTCTQAVAAVASSVALTATPGMTNYGQPVTLTATVTPTSGSGAPTGTVTFRDGSTAVAQVVLNASGVATLTTASLTVRSHTITAIYSGDGNTSTGSSGAQTVVVAQSATSVSLASSASASTYGQAVTFIAAVSPVAPGGGTVTGTVTFQDGSKGLGTVVLANGFATLTTSALVLGSHTITAGYNATTNDKASTSSLTQEVNPVPTTTTLASSDAVAAVVGETLTLSAAVAAANPSVVPTGVVTFFDGSVTLGTGTLATGVAKLNLKTLALGSHSLTASYAGSGPCQGSVSTLALGQVVSQDTTQVTLAASSTSATVGQAVTLTATVAVAAPGSGTPTGTVTFSDGATVLGTGTLSGGVAKLTTAKLGAGGHALTASYAGDPNDLPSTTTSAATVNVGQASSDTTLKTSVSSPVFGQPVKLTATVAGTPTTTGSVTFYDGTMMLGTGAVALTGGVATLTTSSLAVGTHALTASYGGDVNYLSGGTAIATAVTVGQASTTIALAASPTTAVYSQSESLTATVVATAPATGTPTGTVTFLDGTTVIGTAMLASGVARLSTTALALGSNTLTASYATDGNYQSSTTTTPATVTVGQDTTTATLTSSNASAVSGQTVVLKATVRPGSPATGTPTGTVTFLDGATSVGTASLVGGIATLALSTLPVGTHSLTASYAGDPDFTGSNTTTTLSLSVGLASGSLTASASATTTNYGQPVTFTALLTAIAPGSGTPTGNVVVKDNGTAIGTVALDATGATSFTTQNPLAIGNHMIALAYLGDSRFRATSATIAVAVAQTATTTTLAPMPSPSAFGETVALTATVSQNSGVITPNGAVTFVLDSTNTLGPATLNAHGQATVTVSALALGTHSVQAFYQGTGSFLASSSAFTPQVVNPVTTTTLLTSSDPQNAVIGEVVKFTVTVKPTVGNAVPAGTVAIDDGSSLLISLPLSTTGTAQWPTGVLALGAHPLTVTYTPSVSSFLGSQTASALAQQIAPAPTATTLTVSPATSKVGQPITITAAVAAVTPGAGNPSSGTVQFYADGSAIATPQPVSNGQATLTYTALAKGQHLLTATYQGGDANFVASDPSLAVTELVNFAATSVTLTASTGTTTYSHEVFFNATINVLAPATATPTGNFSVYLTNASQKISNMDIGDLLNYGTPAAYGYVLPAGTNLVKFTYNGDADTATSSSTITVVVTPASTTTTVSAQGPSPWTFGGNATLTAQVSGVNTGPYGPTGTVKFTYNNGIQLGSAPVVNGVASISTNVLTAGMDTVKAVYTPDTTDFLGSSDPNPLTLSVGKGAPTFTWATNQPTGQANIVITVDSSGPVSPSGSLVIYYQFYYFDAFHNSHYFQNHFTLSTHISGSSNGVYFSTYTIDLSNYVHGGYFTATAYYSGDANLHGNNDGQYESVNVSDTIP